MQAGALGMLGRVQGGCAVPQPIGRCIAPVRAANLKAFPSPGSIAPALCCATCVCVCCIA